MREWREVIVRTTTNRRLHYKDGNAFERTGEMLQALDNAFSLLRCKPIDGLSRMCRCHEDARYKKFSIFAILISVHIHLFVPGLHGLEKFVSAYRAKMEDLFFVDEFHPAKTALRVSLNIVPDECRFYMRQNESKGCLCLKCRKIFQRWISRYVGSNIGMLCITYL